MKLSRFIEIDADRIVDDWEQFARTRLPAAQGLAPEALRDHAKVLLLQVAVDLETGQTDAEQRDKSRGNRPDHARGLTETAQQHAEQRFAEGFTLDQMVAEYLALRASVVRLWTAKLRAAADRATLDELVRFDEAIDQALGASITWYAAKVEASRSPLLGVLGHDLRNPLGAIRNSASYLLRSERLGGAQTKAAARILSSSTRVRRMIDDLLDFTRAQLGHGLPVRLNPADLGAVCHQAVDELRAFHPDAMVRMDCEGDLAGRWDAQRIAQLVSNLLANAIQHGTPDTPVTVSVPGESDVVEVQVHNHGPPIAVAKHSALFEPLAPSGAKPWAERRDGTSGLGRGLYISRQFALAHQGSIEVASSESDGTRFTVRLPRQP